MTLSRFSLLASLLLSAPLPAQQHAIPVHQLGRILRTSADSFGRISSARVLSDGRVLVNDGSGQRVALLDSTLQHAVSVADTSSGTKKAYGSRGGTLLSYFGDSSVFVDAASTSMLVIDPAGKIVRVNAIPAPPNLINYFTVLNYGLAFDGRGVFFVKASGPSGSRNLLAGLQPGEHKVVDQDSAVILRITASTHQVDTVGRLKITRQDLTSTTGASLIKSPFYPADDWALLPDGTIAILRVFDYHVDFIAPDGSRSGTPKIQHDWIRITDSAKSAMVDVLRSADSVRRAVTIADRARRDSVVRSGRPDPGPGPGANTGVPPLNPYIDPSALPDYWPPFVSTAPGIGSGSNVFADADGNLWIRIDQHPPIEAGTIYDIVNRQGVVVDRVQIPGSTSIVGFAPGVAYLSSRVSARSVLVRARIR